MPGNVLVGIGGAYELDRSHWWWTVAVKCVDEAVGRCLCRANNAVGGGGLGSSVREEIGIVNVFAGDTATAE